mgnify:CR=1 FL=1
MEDFYSKIYQILRAGGKLTITNRKGLQLDISLDFAAFFSKSKQKVEKIDFNKEKMIEEMTELKNEIIKLKEIKNIRDNYIIRKKLYEESDEGRLVKRLMNKNIKDINAAIKNYDEKSAERLIEKEYNSQLDTTIREQMSEEYNKSKLDAITDNYNKKYRINKS